MIVYKIDSHGDVPASIKGLGVWRCTVVGGDLNLCLDLPDNKTAFVAETIRFRRCAEGDSTFEDLVPYNFPHMSSDEFLQLMLDCAWKRGLRPNGVEVPAKETVGRFEGIFLAIREGFEGVSEGRLDVTNVSLWDHGKRIEITACGGGEAFMASADAPAGMMKSPCELEMSIFLTLGADFARAILK